MTKLPEDFIDVSAIKIGSSTKVRNRVLACVKRFYEQDYTIDHVLGVLTSDPIHGRIPVKDTIRHELHRMEKNSVIVLVKRGKSGKPNVYRNRSDEGQKK